ncbi:hypothetical protein IHN59_18055, partial [Deinococcus sp. 23YEL01]|nr:hypothetical protein [Deinococcus sp. 23YEL01]
MRLRAALLAGALLLLGEAQAARLKVIVSFHPLYDVVTRVAGDAADVDRRRESM